MTALPVVCVLKSPVGFLGLIEPPAVREEPLYFHLLVGDELGALGLALLRERPRPHQRSLPAQERSGLASSVT
jgi:hypothetical protein